MKIIPFWRTKRSLTVTEYFYGKVMKRGSFILTQAGDLFWFKHGVNDHLYDSNHYPILEFIRKMKVPKFKEDDLQIINGKIYDLLGDARIYKLDKDEYFWEYS
jgi:hypothetical protein